MAEEIKPHEQALDDAVRAYVAVESEGDCVVTGFVLATSGVVVAEAGQSWFQYRTSADQPMHASLGLVEMLRLWLAREYNNDGD